MEVPRDQEVTQARLPVGQQASVLLELGGARPGGTQLLALGHDATDLGDEGLDRVVDGTHGRHDTARDRCQ